MLHARAGALGAVTPVSAGRRCRSHGGFIYLSPWQRSERRRFYLGILEAPLHIMCKLFYIVY